MSWKSRAAAACMMLWAGTAGAAGQAGNDWPSFFGNDAGWSYSPLDQINRSNVGQLEAAWSFSTGEKGMGATPLVLDGVMYLAAPRDQIFALDAATGKLLWTHVRELPEGRVGRGAAGIAAGFGLIFFGTLDNHLVALDAKTGAEVWDVLIEDPNQCGCSPGFAPILVKDKVVIGVRGEVAHRSYVNAFDAKTGALAWRFWVIPGPGEKGHETWPRSDLWRFGGGSTWYVGSYDPSLNLVYWGVGNPAPMLGGTEPGDKLYTNSLVALDADTGKLKWAYQEQPADTLDFDSTTEPMLIDLPVAGRMRKLVVHSNKGGMTFVLDRATGQFLTGYDHADVVNWNKGLDAKGRLLEVVKLEKGVEKLICPSLYGSRAANHGAFSPRTGFWYGTSFETCAYQVGMEPGKITEGQLFNAGALTPVRSTSSEPFIAAYDPLTGARRWVVKTGIPNVSSLTVTGGDVLFGGDPLGDAWAMDATTGKKLWRFNVGSGVSNSPITYQVGNRQYVAFGAGISSAPAALIARLWPEMRDKLPPNGSSIFVFALPEGAGQ